MQKSRLQVRGTQRAASGARPTGSPRPGARRRTKVIESKLGLFIPSGSGQAFVTMPIMAPLASLTGVPPQTAVLAYQFGDGFTNMVVPTSALVMGTLALARIPYGAWLRFAGPLILKLFAVAAVFVVLSVHFSRA